MILFNICTLYNLVFIKYQKEVIQYKKAFTVCFNRLNTIVKKKACLCDCSCYYHNSPFYSAEELDYAHLLQLCSLKGTSVYSWEEKSSSLFERSTTVCPRLLWKALWIQLVLPQVQLKGPVSTGKLVKYLLHTTFRPGITVCFSNVGNWLCFNCFSN